jgi:hypothetical protein
MKQVNESEMKRLEAAMAKGVTKHQALNEISGGKKVTKATKKAPK